MPELEPVGSIDDITNRWPGIADHDLEQGAAFVEYCVSPHGNVVRDFLHDSDDPRAELLWELARSALWRLDSPEDQTRERFLSIAARTFYSEDESEAVEAIQSGDPEKAEARVQRFLARWPMQLEVSYQESPLFPHGREIHIPVDLKNGEKIKAPERSKYVVDCYGGKETVRDQIIEYIKRPRDLDTTAYNAAIRSLAENFVRIDQEQYTTLRQTYGTKAANLFVFAEALDGLRTAATEKYDIPDIKVPKFTAAPTMLHRMYKTGDPRYENYLEQIRQQAIAVSSTEFDPELYRPLVAVRSSAVLSEDGENASGAGVYASTAADPRNPQAFRQAVEEVFTSLESKQAKAYLANKGIENEEMGLVIQDYLEALQGFRSDYAYGYIASSDPYGRFIPLSSNHGELVYDKNAVESVFMTGVPFSRGQPTLHYVPDHSEDIANFTRHGAAAAHAALFGEKMFGKQVELEFVFNDSFTANIVQVRPQPSSQKPKMEVEFPIDTEPLFECKAIGVGDVVVTIRDDLDYEPDEIKINWVDTENRQGDSLAYRPTDAVFVIGHNDGYSGHIQMLAKERGQICLYPEAQTRLPWEIEQLVVTDPRKHRVRKLRIIADGYRGAIYSVAENPVLSQERETLLERLASDLAALVFEKSRIE